MEDYFAILVFLGIALGLSLVLVIIPHLLDKVFGVVRHDGDVEKLSSYECGFEPFQDARGKFDVQFYLVAILFIIFDLEIAFLFPWAIGLSEVGEFGFWSMMVFLSVLTIGFVYEWRKGALEWQ